MLLLLKRRQNWFCVLTIIVGIILGFSDASFAEMFHSVTPILIQSEISAGSEDPQDIRNNRWSVVSDKNSDGSTILSFYMEGTDQPLCQLEVSATDYRIKWLTGTRGPSVILSDELLIASGYPAPCDILPVAKAISSIGEATSYEIKRKAGGSTVNEKFRVESIVVKVEEAKNNGWIRNNLDVKENLYMIRVYNLRTNGLMVQQLWPADGAWWIYEETPSRHSWRIQ